MNRCLSFGLIGIGVILALVGLIVLLGTMTKSPVAEEQALTGAMGFILIVTGFCIAFIILVRKKSSGNLRKLFVFDVVKLTVLFIAWGLTWSHLPQMDALFDEGLIPESIDNPYLYSKFIWNFGAYFASDFMGFEELIYVFWVRIPIILLTLYVLLALYFDRKDNWKGRVALYGLAMVPFIWMWANTFFLLPMKYGALDYTINTIAIFGFDSTIVIVELVSMLTLHISFLYTGILLYNERSLCLDGRGQRNFPYRLRKRSTK